MAKEDFIRFVKSNPNLIDYVRKNNDSWQNLYEIYTLYGEDELAWNKYLNSRDNSIDELVSLIKKVNLESVKKVVDGLQKTISLVQQIGTNEEYKQPYEKSPVFGDLDD